PWERQDPVWTLVAFRLSRYLLDLARADLRGVAHRVPLRTRDQLLRCVASIGANIGEGYARPGNAERARFYAYALGSAREASVWYRAVGDALPGEVVEQRVEVLARIRRLLLGLMKAARGRRW
ncbi:MAG: four helix bundle protein, partial [Gemmatimonadota bacterium]|nr:four helix bundle protein [Gemmatimonadota bacterium]